MTVRDILLRCKNAGIRDETGEVLDVRFERPVSSNALRALEHRIGQRVPQQLSDLLGISDGMILFRHDFRAASEMKYFPRHRLLEFHDWGTDRDVDCIALAGAEWPVGSIVFVNGDPKRAFKYADNLEKWLAQVLEEVTVAGDWHCPGNYRRFGIDGVAKDVVEVADRLGWRLSPPTIDELRKRYPHL